MVFISFREANIVLLIVQVGLTFNVKDIKKYCPNYGACNFVLTVSYIYLLYRTYFIIRRFHEK
jgi:hypothetical protein